MAQVPYNPVPSATPQSPGEQISINTPGAAFGENIGAALQKMGVVGEQVGGEVFQRAVAIQELNNENMAREAAKNNAEEITKEQATFDGLEGQAKVNALVPHLQRIRQITQGFRDNLPNPAAQRQYDAMTFGFYERNLFSSSRQAGDALKSYTLDTLKATSDMAGKAANDHPEDDDFNKRQLAVKIEADAKQAMLRAGVHDYDNPIVQDAIMKARSSFWKDRMLGMDVTNSPGASKMFDAHKDELTEQDKDYVQNRINGRSAAVFASNFAENFYDRHRQPDGTLDITRQEAVEAIRKEAKEQLPNNPMAPEAAVTKFDQMVYHDYRARVIDGTDTGHKIDQAIIQNNVTDWQHLLAIPGMDTEAAKWQKYNPGKSLAEHVFDVQKAAGRVTKEASMHQLLGATATEDGQKWLLEQNPWDPQWHLDTNSAMRVQAEQLKLSKDPATDRRVTNAFNLLKAFRGTELGADGLNIIRRSDNPGDFDHFMGSLQEALQIWQTDHGKPPTNKDIVDTIGPEVIKTRAATWGYGLFGGGLEFRNYTRPNIEDVPEAWKAKLTRDITAKGGATPNDQQLIDAYARFQYLKLFRKSSDGKENASGSASAPSR